MAVGKNKRISKGKKGGKKKATDPFAKKDWYDIKAPTMFKIRTVGKTLVTRTQGTKIAADGLKGRVFEVTLADLQSDPMSGEESMAHRKIKLHAEDVQGRHVLTNFWGMDLTTDKLRQLVRKWQSLIEAYVDIKTTDNFLLRLFAIGFTTSPANKNRKDNMPIPGRFYAQTAKIRQIRKKMREVMVAHAAGCDLKELVGKFIDTSTNGQDKIGAAMEKACEGIYPLHNVYLRKVKILKAPKFDLQKLMEVHGDYSNEEVGTKIERPAEETEAAPAEETPAEA
jgi:small subunit ribosomal protein S3Ae